MGARRNKCRDRPNASCFLTPTMCDNAANRLFCVPELVQNILGYCYYTDKHIKPELEDLILYYSYIDMLKLRLINRCCSEATMVVLFKTARNPQLEYLKTLVEHGVDRYTKLVRNIRLDLNQEDWDTASRLCHGPSIRFENINELRILPPAYAEDEFTDTVFLGSFIHKCGSIDNIVIERFLTEELNELLYLMKYIMPNTRHHIDLVLDDIDFIDCVLGQLTSDIDMLGNLALYHKQPLRRETQDFEAMFETLVQYPELWPHISHIVMVRYLFETEYLYSINSEMVVNIKTFVLKVKTMEDEDSPPVAKELLRVMKGCINIRDLRLDIANAKDGPIDDKWINEFVALNPGVASNLEVLRLKCTTWGDQTFTMEALKSLKSCKALSHLCLANALADHCSDDVREAYLQDGRIHKDEIVMKYDFSKLGPKDCSVWFPNLVKFDLIHLPEDWNLSIPQLVQYHMPSCIWIDNPFRDHDCDEWGLDRF